MGGKKLKSDVENLRKDIRTLSEAMWALRDKVTFEAAAVAAANSSGKVHTEIAKLATVDNEEGGTVATSGAMRDASGNREYRWEQSVSVDSLLDVEDESWVRVLAAIGHRQRLAILTTLLRDSASAAELVSTLELGTTGAAYHHLNVLIAAGVVSQESRGVFAVEPDQVGSVVTILAGLATVTSVADVPAVENTKAKSSKDKSGKKAA